MDSLVSDVLILLQLLCGSDPQAVTAASPLDHPHADMSC